jgi:A/G-specific adenine glycosylase
MLQQTQVKAVVPYWERWIRRLPSIAALARAKPQRVLKLWEGLGYYTRARNLQKAAQLILNQHGGKFPERFEQVLALPGVGRYTAGAICSIAFDQPTPVLDGNVIRVLTRLFGIGGNPRERVTNTRLWHLAEMLVLEAAKLKPALRGRWSSSFSLPRPAKSRPDKLKVELQRELQPGPCSLLNQALMELGAIVCTPRQPRCAACPLRRHCVARRTRRVHALPNLGRRKPTVSRRLVAFVVERRGLFLVRQRPAGVVNARLWEFPNLESLASDGELTDLAAQQLVLRLKSLRPLCVVKHSITRHRITLEAFRAELDGTAPATRDGTRWLAPQELRKLPFPSAHRKILHRLERERSPARAARHSSPVTRHSSPDAPALAGRDGTVPSAAIPARVQAWPGRTAGPPLRSRRATFPAPLPRGGSR